MTKNNSSYLIEGRLSDVLSLIQVLAFDKNTSRSESGIKEELKEKPISADTWIDLGKLHSEFFRVRYDEHGEEDDEGNVNRISLVSRYVLPHESVNGKKKRPPLTPDIVNKLMELAIELHDRQINRAEQWKIIVPMIVAIVSAAASIVAAIIGAGT